MPSRLTRNLATILISLALFSASLPVVFAEEQKDSSRFEVFEILSTNDEKTSKNFKDAADKSKNSTVSEVLLRAINILTLMVGTFAFVVIMIAGFKLIYAQGDQTKIDSSKQMITQAIFGLLFAFFSYIIVTFVQSILY